MNDVQNTSTNNTFKVYSCGGTAANIMSLYTARESHSKKNISISYFDTSRANLHQSIPDEDTFVIGGKGSGSFRALNHSEIVKHVPQALLDHPPARFNVVLFSAGGGTGSVFGPVLASELIRAGHDVVVIVIGSDDSIISQTNTHKTLQSLHNLALNTLEIPIVASYYDNNKLGSSNVDREVINQIELLRLITSTNPRGLDENDVHHWLRYNTIINVAPGLATLEVVTSETVKNLSSRAVAALSIGVDHDAVRGLGVPVEYSTFGIIDQEDLPEGLKAIHYIISDDKIMDHVDDLVKRTQGNQASVSARVSKGTISLEGVTAAEGGMIL